MTTLTATTTTEETRWEEPYPEIIDDDFPFEDLSSTEFESEIGDILADPSEDLFSLSQSLGGEEVHYSNALKTPATQNHIATALGSALHQTLAKYSVKDAKSCEDPDKKSIHQNLSVISQFWDGWFEDIEIDDEINSEDNKTNNIAEDISQTDQRNSRKKNNAIILKNDVTTTASSSSSSSQTTTADVLKLKISPIPRVLTPLIIDVTAKSKNEVTSLLLKSKGKNSEILPSSLDELESSPDKSKKTSKRNAGGKPKKRKLNVLSDQIIEPSPSEKRSKPQRKKVAKNLQNFKEVFKVEQVLKIEAVEKDFEDEEIDIGDLTDAIL